MTPSADVVILGGGIAGLTLALAAAARGQRVMVVDEPRQGAASRAAAGMLAPTIEGLPASVHHAAIAARDFYPRLLDRLRETTAMEVPLDRAGILELADDDAGLARLAERRLPGVEQLDRRALASVEPALAGHAGALCYRLDGAVDNVRLMEALDRAATAEPRITRVTGAAVALELGAASGTVLLADGSRQAGARVVLAAGAWAGGLPGLPRALPISPVRGQLLQLAASPIRHVTYGAGGYLIPRGATLVVGATSELAGFDASTTGAGLTALRRVASRAVPALADASVVKHWAGLRPMTPDGLPILGPDPDHPALVYACGFSRNGILFAPWAAELLAELLAGGARPPALEPFRVGRFGE